jgi:branched-chain amino acid transport system substrate-binding protein
VKEDDQLKPEVGQQAVRKLIDKDKVDAIVGLSFSNVLMGSLPRLAESGVGAIATNAGPSPLAGAQCKANLFSMAWQNDGAVETMGKFAQDCSLKPVYLMPPNDQAGKDRLAGFKRVYKGQVVDVAYTQVNLSDYSAEIAQLQAARRDALFVFYPGGLGINFVKQVSQAGLSGKLPLYSVFTVEGMTLPSLREAAVGTISGGMYDAALDNPENRKFVAAFEAKYKRTEAADRSSCSLQLGRIEQKIAGITPGCPVPIVAHDDDALDAADDGWAHAFSPRQASQSGDRDSARWCTGLAAPLPEAEVGLFA